MVWSSLFPVATGEDIPHVHASLTVEVHSWIYPIIYRVWDIPGGAGVLPLTASTDFEHVMICYVCFGRVFMFILGGKYTSNIAMGITTHIWRSGWARVHFFGTLIFQANGVEPNNMWVQLWNIEYDYNPNLTQIFNKHTISLVVSGDMYPFCSKEVVQHRFLLNNLRVKWAVPIQIPVEQYCKAAFLLHNPCRLSQWPLYISAISEDRILTQHDQMPFWPCGYSKKLLVNIRAL